MDDYRFINDFQKFSATNKNRATEWHKSGLEDWTISDWSNAFAGEAGELCNAVKKLRRLQSSIVAHDGDTPQPETIKEAIKAIGKEIGDVYTYLDLVAQRLNLDTWSCIQQAFNQISEREGFKHRV